MSLYEIIKLKKCFKLWGTDIWRKMFYKRIVFGVTLKLNQTRGQLKWTCKLTKVTNFCRQLCVLSSLHVDSRRCNKKQNGSERTLSSFQMVSCRRHSVSDHPHAVHQKGIRRKKHGLWKNILVPNELHSTFWFHLLDAQSEFQSRTSRTKNHSSIPIYLLLTSK